MVPRKRPKHPDKLNKIERRIYDELIKLREAEKLNPTCDDEQRQAFLNNFSWDDSILTEHEQQRIEELLVKYHTIFARHRLDIGINTDFKIKLTPKHDDPVYAQSLPTPTNLKDDLLVERALMQEYGIITTLPYSKYSSPVFARTKTQREISDISRLEADQPPPQKRLQQTQPSSDNNCRCSPAHGWQEVLLQA